MKIAPTREQNEAAWKLAMTVKSAVSGHARKVSMATGVDREELEQVGIIGAYRAGLLFDTAHNVTFSHYARWWYRALIGLYAWEQSGAVRRPRAMYEQIVSGGRPDPILTQSLDAHVGGMDEDDGVRMVDLTADPVSDPDVMFRMIELGRLLEAVPVKHRDCILLSMQGYSHEEIYGMTAIDSVSGVTRALERGKAKMRRRAKVYTGGNDV